MILACLSLFMIRLNEVSHTHPLPPTNAFVLVAGARRLLRLGGLRGRSCAPLSGEDAMFATEDSRDERDAPT